MMRLGKGEEVEKALEELFEGPEENQEFEGYLPSEKVLIIPADAKISSEAIEVAGETVIGNNCMLIGNLQTQAVETGKNLTLKGSVYSEGQISIGDNSTIYGNLSSKAQVNIGRNCRVFGGIKADSVVLYENARVEGTIKAPSGLSFIREAAEMPVLAGVNALGKQIVNEVHDSFKNDSKEGIVKALSLTEINSLITAPAKAKDGFVPGREEMSAKTQALARTRRIGGVKSLRRRHAAGENPG